MKDEILAELWAAKDEIARENASNSQVLIKRLKQIQVTLQQPVVNRTNQRKKQPA